MRANQRDGGVHLDHGQPPAGCRDRVTLARVRISRACNTSSAIWKVRQSTILGAPSLSLMKSVIVLSVSAWGAVSFLRSRSTSLSPVKCFVIVFSFRGVVGAQSVKISSLLCSAHPVGTHAQIPCEKGRLLEGDEVVALL